MKVLITGGGGFVGSHLAQYYIEKVGADVIILDNFSTGQHTNVEALPDFDGLDIVEGDVRDEEVVDGRMADADRVFHLAAAVGVRRILEDPIGSLKTNLRGTENVLQAAEKRGIETFIASSSEVYGKSQSIPFGEEDDRVLGPTSSPRWGYATAKAADEFLALAYNEKRGLPVVVGRLFNVVGPRQVGEYGMVVPRFVQQALAGDPITVYGDGTQQRCFTHVHDAVEVIHRLMDTKEAPGEVVNIGVEEPVSINELAERVVALAESDSEIIHVPFEEAYDESFEEPTRRQPDISKLESLVDTVPEADIDRIVTDVIEHIRKEL